MYKSIKLVEGVARYVEILLMFVDGFWGEEAFF